MASDQSFQFRGSAATHTITLASLASSVAGVGRIGTKITNTNKDPQAKVYGLITTGTSPTANRWIALYSILFGDGTYDPDNAGASDAAFTVVAVKPFLIIPTSSSSNVGYEFNEVIDLWGQDFAIAVVHATGVNLNSTGGNHAIKSDFGRFQMS